MVENDVSATVLTSMHNVAYYSGFLYCSFGRPYACVVAPKAIFFWLAIASLDATAEGPHWIPFVFVLVSVSVSLIIHAG
ncbi:hypothetical protein OAM69_06005, partial [bacterium]|nr:hypothetical protein [bacterium]